MNAETTVMVIEGLVAVVVLAVFFYGPWQKLVVDIARQNIFEIRDELFDKAVSRGLKPSSDTPYKELRQFLNALIQHAETLNWGMMLAVRGAHAPDPLRPVLRAIEDVEEREYVRRRIEYAVLTVIALIWLRSPLLMLLSMLLLPVAAVLLLLGGREAVDRVRVAVRRLEADVRRDVCYA